MLRKLSQVQSDLQALAAQKGAKLFDAAKDAYLKSVIVTDEDGTTPLSPDAITFDIKFETPAETKADDSTDIRKAIRDTITDELAKSARPQVRISAGEIVQKDGTVYKAPRGRSKYFETAQKAHDFGMFMGAVLGFDSAKRYCANKGITLQKGFQSFKGAVEGTNTAGGFLVDDGVLDDLIVLRERYGVFRRNSRVLPMTSDTLPIKKQTGFHTAYFVGEAQAGTESSASFVRDTLVAKKIMVLDTASSEFSEDSAVAFGDIWANDIAYAMSLKEDQCGFIGDGTSTYGGIVGLSSAFAALGTVANTAGVYSATAAWDSITMANIQSWLALLPAYAAGPNCKFYCHKAFYHNVLERLAFTAGGTTTIDIKGGVPVQSFMGYPVEFCQVLPATTATTQYDAYFGDLTMATYFGDRRGITVATSDSALNAFEQDEIAYKATERFDIVCGNLGNNSATASLRVAGPIVAFYRAS